jgi:drug/metabolite transporter (DMT)-like permease
MSTRGQAELFLLSVTLIWGTTFVATKLILSHISPFLYVVIRFSLASIIFAVLTWKNVRVTTVGAAQKGFFLGVLLFTGFALQTIGLEYTTASKSAFVTGMLVVFTPLCQILIEKRAPKLGNIVGVILVTAGLFFLTSPKGSEFNFGDALTLGCALCFALYIVCLDIFTKEHDAAQLTLIQFATAAVGGGLMAGTFEHTWIELHPTLIWWVLYLTVAATVVAIYVQTKYQKETTPTRAAVIFSVEPVIAAVFAYFVLGEVLGVLGILGGGLIVAGVLVSELS